HLAEDLTADVFMRLLEAVKEGRGPRTTLRGWLMATASNMINDYYRKSYRRKTEELSDDLRAEGPTPHIRVEKRERKQAVHMALEKLTPDQQNILSLRFGSGYSLEETAEAIGKNVNAVKQLQFRALAALRRHLGEEPV
ncbi:MAG TPA: sigma-70 family RNA polymerase sigma factor, partial [Anaerolineales bacterium]|nr:sigma-70 family RNA polymerase sigma factor [Anaerolineales bacterium]